MQYLGFFAHEHKNLLHRVAPSKGPASKTADVPLLRIPLVSGISRLWIPPTGGIHKAKQRAEQKTQNPEALNPAFHGLREVFQRRATVSRRKTTLALNQKQTGVSLRKRRSGIEDFLSKTKSLRPAFLHQDGRTGPPIYPDIFD